jgi:RNA polymerase sigma factor (TIGR02999 family)
VQHHSRGSDPWDGGSRRTDARAADQAPASVRIGQITRLLHACADGDDQAFQQLIPLVYGELRRIARRQLRRDRQSWTLNTTGLVHEAYLKLVDHTQLEWRNRSHFYAVAARAMRQVVVDSARKRCTRRRGWNTLHLALDQADPAVASQAEVFVALDQALENLAVIDERLVRVVECRFFAGYSESETAEALATSLRTVQRDWKRARAWLREEVVSIPAEA